MKNKYQKIWYCQIIYIYCSMDKEQAVRWIYHRLNNRTHFSDFDYSFIKNYLKLVKDYDITMEEVHQQVIAVIQNPRRNLLSYIEHMIDHVALHFSIMIAFNKDLSKILKIY